MKLVWTIPADRDMGAIFEYIMALNPSSAFSEVEKIADTVGLLAGMPKSGVYMGDGEFYKVVPSSRFTVFYFLNEDKGILSILRVLHQSTKLADYRGDDGDPFDLLN